MSYLLVGLQRSGTNLTETIMKDNYSVDSARYDPEGLGSHWKHRLNAPKEILYNNVIIIHKNPYTWIESIAFRDSVDFKSSQRTFPADEVHEDPDYMIGSPWVVKHRKNLFNLINLAKTWDAFHTNWVLNNDLEDKNLVIVKYEDLLEEDKRGDLIRSIGSSFNYKQKTSKIIFPDKGSVAGSKRYNSEIEDYYKLGMPKNLTKKQIDAVNKTINPKIMNVLGYKFIDGN